MKDKLLVTQSYELVNSKYKVSELEAKIIMLTVAQLHKDDTNFTTYKMSIGDISDKLKSKQNHTLLRKTAEDLLSKPLFIETENGWKGFNWFSYIEYDRDEATLKVAVDDRLRPYLLELRKNFVSHDLEHIVKMNSTYAIRIYQLLKQYQKIGNRTLNVADMQEMFKVPKSMLRFDNFKRKILEVSVEQINKYTDLEVSFTEIKTGRKVTDINFIIKHKQKEEPSLLSEEDLETSLETDVQMMIGLHNIKQIIPLKDGSFKVLFEDDTQDICKTKKQLKFKFDKEYGERNENE